ncbi:MAG: sugar transferase [Thermoanaerobaculia bacterium]
MRLSWYRRNGKRLLDVGLCLVGFCFLWPLFLAVAATVRIRMGRPVLLRQERPGLGGAAFVLVKFRTMTADRGPDGGLLPDVDRLTGTGRMLRRWSLDELPELWNVLKGDMSLVGPRPLLMEYLPLYSVEQRRRHDVRPGITGWAQVNGRNAQSWEERFGLDVWYVDHVSFFFDLRILFRTVGEVVKRRGVSAPSHATMPRFKGNDV